MNIRNSSHSSHVSAMGYYAFEGRVWLTTRKNPAETKVPKKIVRSKLRKRSMERMEESLTVPDVEKIYILFRKI